MANQKTFGERLIGELREGLEALRETPDSLRQTTVTVETKSVNLSPARNAKKKIVTVKAPALRKQATKA